MKNLSICFGLLFFLSPYLTANSHTDLIQRIERQVVSTSPHSNADAIYHPLRLNLYIKEMVYNTQIHENFGPYMADLACKAYALDEHWLLVAATCMRPTQSDLWQVGDHLFLQRHSRQSFWPDQTPFENYRENKRIMLVWQEKPIYQAPFVKVLAVSSPKTLIAMGGNGVLKINTGRFGTDAVRTRTPDVNSVRGNTLRLKQIPGQLTGTATDPLFFINRQKNEFVVGYNNGSLDYWYAISLADVFRTFNGLSSHIWYTLTKNDLLFIQKTVQTYRPQDWQRIKTRLFYNTTNTPYFK